VGTAVAPATDEDEDEFDDGDEDDVDDEVDSPRENITEPKPTNATASTITTIHRRAPCNIRRDGWSCGVVVM